MDAEPTTRAPLRRRPHSRAGGAGRPLCARSRISSMTTPLDPRIDSPGREGLTGTARSSVYEPAADPERSRSPRTGGPTPMPARLAQGLPDRLAGGPLRRPARLHQVPGAHQPRLRRRPVLDRGAAAGGANGRRPAPEAHRRAPGPRRPAAALMFNYPGEHDPCLLLRLRDGDAPGLRPEVHAPLLRGRPAIPSGESSTALATRASSISAPGRPHRRAAAAAAARDRLEVRGEDVYATGVEERTV